MSTANIHFPRVAPYSPHLLLRHLFLSLVVTVADQSNSQSSRNENHFLPRFPISPISQPSPFNPGMRGVLQGLLHSTTKLSQKAEVVLVARCRSQPRDKRPHHPRGPTRSYDDLGSYRAVLHDPVDHQASRLTLFVIPSCSMRAVEHIKGARSRRTIY